MGWLDDKPKTDIEVIEYTLKQPSETSTHHLKDFFIHSFLLCYIRFSVQISLLPPKKVSFIKRASSLIYALRQVSLVGGNGAELLVGAFRSRRSISGPELAG